MRRSFGAVAATILVLVMLLASYCFAGGKQFHLGIISEKPVEKKIEEYAPLARYVAERLKQFHITGGKVIIAGDLDDMLHKIRDKEVDVVLESPFTTLKIHDTAGMKPKLLVRKHGVKYYKTVFIVRKESPITRLSELKGKTIALQDPGSTSAYLIPKAELKRRGMEVVPSTGTAPSSAVKYMLVEHEKNQAFWVLQKKADAAAFSSDDWAEVTAKEKSELKVIHSTKPVLRYIASFRPGLSPALVKAVSRIFTRMDQDQEGRKVLEQASHTSKIEQLSAQDMKSLEYVRELMLK